MNLILRARKYKKNITYHNLYSSQINIYICLFSFIKIFLNFVYHNNKKRLIFLQVLFIKKNKFQEKVVVKSTLFL